MRVFPILLLLVFFTIQQAHAEWSNTIPIDQVYTPMDLNEDIEAFSDKYPHLLQTEVIGHSSYNQPIWAIKLGKGENHILIHASHHGREWITSMIVMKMIEEYAEAYKKGKSYQEIPTALLDKVSIWFVPMVNPDGVEIQQNGLSQSLSIDPHDLLLMNGGSVDYARWKANGKGIDLNRQYPAGWGELAGSSPFPFYQLYKGTEPLIAPEVKALEQFTRKINPEIAVAYHSSGRVVYWYYQTNIGHVMRDWRIANHVAETTGYKLDKPVKTATGGGFTDWFIQTFERPGLTIEVGYEVNETNPPLSVLKEEWQRNRTVGLLLIKEALNLIKTTE
ncbi:M14 family metallopeptidase [Bacillus sp. AK128]